MNHLPFCTLPGVVPSNNQVKFEQNGMPANALEKITDLLFRTKLYASESLTAVSLKEARSRSALSFPLVYMVRQSNNPVKFNEIHAICEVEKCTNPKISSKFETCDLENM